MPTEIDGGLPFPSSWRDLAGELTAEQIAALGVFEAHGCNPAMLLMDARKLAAHNLDGWL